MITEKFARDLIAAALGSTIDEVCSEHYGGLTQEPAMTSRIGAALEERFNKRVIGDYELQVVTQEFPDRGKGALEKRVGADLYVGISVHHGRQIESKGFLVQAKMYKKRRVNLHEQCDEMMKRTDAGYVWVYRKDGVRSVQSERVLALERLHGDPVTEMLARVLECVEGDRALALPLTASPRRQLRQEIGEMIRGLAGPVHTAFLIEVKHPTEI